jgi:hypothetical protein
LAFRQLVALVTVHASVNPANASNVSNPNCVRFDGWRVSRECFVKPFQIGNIDGLALKVFREQILALQLQLCDVLHMIVARLQLQLLRCRAAQLVKPFDAPRYGFIGHGRAPLAAMAAAALAQTQQQAQA